jgi:hypothetical protein
MKTVKSHGGLFGSARWAISDKDKFGFLIDGLRALVGVPETLTQGIGARQRQRELADRELNRIEDIFELVNIEEARLGADDVISEAASTRISSLCNQSSQQTGGSYRTAPSRMADDETET